MVKLTFTPKKGGPGIIFTFFGAGRQPNQELATTAKDLLVAAHRDAHGAGPPQRQGGSAQLASASTASTRAPQGMDVVSVLGGKKRGRPVESAPPTPTLPQHRREELQAQVLRENPKVAEDHAALVATGVVSEESFWRQREAFVQRLLLRLQQKQSLPSALPHETHVEQQGNTIKPKMTPEKQMHIFAGEPATLGAYKRLVQQGSLTPQGFWDAYFRALHVKKELEAEEEVSEVFTAQVKQQRVAACDWPDPFFRQLALGATEQPPTTPSQPVAESFDLQATEEEVLTGHGRGYGTREGTALYHDVAVHEESQVAGQSGEAAARAVHRLGVKQRRVANIVREHNTYSSFVMQGRGAGGSQPSPPLPGERQTDPAADDSHMPLRDLVKPAGTAFVPVHRTLPVSSTPGTPVAPTPAPQGAPSLASLVELGTLPPTVSEAAAVSAIVSSMKDCSRTHDARRRDGQGYRLRGPPELRQAVLSAALNSSEVLRELWSAVLAGDAPRVPAATHKAASKVWQCLKSIKGKLDAVGTALKQEGGRGVQLAMQEAAAFRKSLSAPLTCGLVRYASLCESRGVAPVVDVKAALRVAKFLRISAPGLDEWIATHPEAALPAPVSQP